MFYIGSKGKLKILLLSLKENYEYRSLFPNDFCDYILLQSKDDFIEKSYSKFAKSQPINFYPDQFHLCQNNNIYKMTADYYDILEVAKTASKEDIKKS